MKIIITGGAGFVGSHIADIYVNKGRRGVITDNLGWSQTVTNNKVFGVLALVFKFKTSSL